MFLYTFLQQPLEILQRLGTTGPRGLVFYVRTAEQPFCYKYRHFLISGIANPRFTDLELLGIDLDLEILAFNWKTCEEEGFLLQKRRSLEFSCSSTQQ